MADRAQGYKYQLSVTAYLASLLSKDETVNDYHIFYEVQEVEPFDDIVLAVQYNNLEDFRLYLVQVKSGKVKLDVNTYFKAYNQITKSKRWECFKSQVKQISEEDIQFWYFACQHFRPQPIPFQEGKQLEIGKCTLQDKRRMINKNVYKLFSEDEEITRKYNDFFKNFHVFLNQDDTSTITIRLKGIWALNDTSPIIDYLDKYFNKNKRESLTKTDFEHELLRIRLWDSIVKPTKIVPYQKESALAWNDLTLSYNVTIVKNELDIETRLFGCILRSFDEKITREQWNVCVDNEGKLSKDLKNEFTSKSYKPETLKDLLVYLWKCRKVPLVLKSNSSLPQLNDFLNLKQHYIIIESDPDTRYNEMETYSLTVIKELGDTRAEHLLQSVLVSMQGRQPTSLHTIINGDKRLMQTLTCSDILKLMEPREVYISKECLEAYNYTLFIIETAQPEPTDYDDPDGDSYCIYCYFDQSSEVYEKVNRNVAFKNYKIYRLRLENDKMKLIRRVGENNLDKDFQCLESFQVDQYGNNVYSINGNDAVPIIGEKTRMNCMKYLRRYMRKGTIDSMGYEGGKTSDSTVKFSETIYPDRDFFKEMDGRICVITGEAGIGKTTFLQALIQTCDPQYYFLFCNLAQFQVDMRQNTKKLLKDPLSFLWSKQKLLLYDRFLNTLRKDQKRLILLLDSFDEVTSTCEEQVLKLIRKLNDDACVEKIIIGSRLLFTQLLTNEFPTIKVTKIEQFSNEYNGNYLENWNIDQDSVQSVPLEFATNPLYLDMLRTISQNSKIDFQTLSRWTLYNSIVDSELERYSRRIKHIIDDSEKKHILSFHWRLALKSIFGNNCVTQKFAQEDRMKFTNATRLGMIKYYDGNEDPVFVHHTFAEFFAAQWLLGTTDKEDAKIIYKMMLENDRCSIMDIHSDQFPLHKAVSNANDGDVETFEKIEKLVTDNKEVLLQTDGIGRTGLHIVGCRFHVKCLEIIIRCMRKEGYDLYSRDNLMNWTWIDYCEYTSESFIEEVSSKLYATHEAYWSYYASSPFRKCIDTYVVFRSYHRAINDFLPSILADLLVVRYFVNEDFIKFRNLCLSSETIVEQLPKYFELHQLNLKPLHLAVIYSNANAIRACIQRGDKVNVVDRFGYTPLYYSIMKQNRELVKLLLEKGGAKLTWREDSDFSTFHLSLRIGNKDITKMLIDAIDLKKFDSVLICDAIRFEDTEVIALLLEAEINLNIETRELESLRFVNIRYNDVVQSLKKCYEYNSDVRTMPINEVLLIIDELEKKVPDYTLVSCLALNTAIHTGRNDIVDLLLKKGVNINIKIICYNHAYIYEKVIIESTPLCCAIRSCDIDMVELLLQHGANVNYADNNGLIPLITVIRVISGSDWSLSKPDILDRRLQIAEVLLRSGADVNFKVEGDLTPLDEALNTRDWRIVEMLLLYGANPNNLKEWDYTDILAVLPTENMKIVELLLKNGANPNFKTACGVTPLYVAARRRHADMVRLLFEYGANPDIITCTHTLLAKARQNAEIEVVTLLLDLGEMCFVGPICNPAYSVEVVNLLEAAENHEDIDFTNEINIICNSNETKFINKLVRYAVDLRNTNGVKYLKVLLRLRKPEIDQVFLENFKNHNRCKSSIVYAAKHKSKTIIEILARNGQGVNSIDEFGDTALVPVIRSSKNKSVIKLLLENQADVNLVGKCGNTALAWAIEEQNIGIIEILLKYKATIDSLDGNGFTPLLKAIGKNDVVIVRILLNNGGDVNFACGGGLTPLYAAALTGNPEIIKTLLRYGAKSDIETCGNTLLYNAIKSGCVNIVELLLNGRYSSILANYEVIQRIYRNLAKVNAVYEFGLTPLHLATKAGHHWMVFILLSFHPDSNQVDEQGRTALHYAVEMDRKDIVSELLKRKMNVNIKDENGLTPLDYAKIGGYSDIIDLLSRY